jgi:hypothetical protein
LKHLICVFVKKSYTFVTKKLIYTPSSKNHGKLIHVGLDLVDSALSTTNPARRGPPALEKTTLVQFPQIAQLIELKNIRNFRFELT